MTKMAAAGDISNHRRGKKAQKRSESESLTCSPTSGRAETRPGLFLIDKAVVPLITKMRAVPRQPYGFQGSHTTFKEQRWNLN